MIDQVILTKLDVLIGKVSSKGRSGVVVIGDGETSATGRVFSGLVALSATTVTANVTTKAGDQAINVALTAGTEIEGLYTDITSTGGVVLAYLEG
jgi:hypothetical protein